MVNLSHMTFLFTLCHRKNYNPRPCKIEISNLNAS